MKTENPIPAAIALIVSLFVSGARLDAQSAAPDEFPPVSTPPAAFFDWVDEGDRDAARRFYRKFVDARGLPVLASAEVADLALQRTYQIVTHMLAGRPDVLEAMVNDRMYLIVIGKDQVYTDMPEYRNHPNPAYQNERVRGTGGRPTSFGEENLLSLPIDRYDDESIAVHEFAHTIDDALRSIDPTWTNRRNRAYRQAIAKGLWKNTYAGSNPEELWAENVQAYFDCNRVNNWNHGPIGTREQLKTYDPESYELVRSTFNLSPAQDWRYTYQQPHPTVSPPPARFGIDPYYTKFTWAREFPVVGHQASDAALLRVNDIVRKMFAYRHDILKALIADGLKLVVLGPRESIADLPEYRALANPREIDALARTLDYRPDLKLLVVGEENVLGDPRDPLVGSSQVIRVFAHALHQVAGTRPVDPDWDNRGRQRQQYELRVQRLDVRFDERLTQLHAAAMNSGRWQGAAAVHDRVAYWVEGVLAYFDASGQVPAPSGASHPITTREALQRYDPALHALVHETLAYEGRVDWRLNSSR